MLPPNSWFTEVVADMTKTELVGLKKSIANADKTLIMPISVAFNLVCRLEGRILSDDDVEKDEKDPQVNNSETEEKVTKCEGSFEAHTCQNSKQEIDVKKLNLPDVPANETFDNPTKNVELDKNTEELSRDCPEMWNLQEIFLEKNT